MSEQQWTTPSLQMVDPKQLLLEGNSRTITGIEQDRPELLASIAQHGVRLPIAAHPGEDGCLHVWDGYSRTMAAVSLGLDTVPVYVTDPSDTEGWARLRSQWIANQHRDGFSSQDQAKLMDELTLFGLTAEQIAGELGEAEATVEAGVRVYRGTRSREVLEQYPQLDLVQVAAFDEFAADDEAIEELTATLEEEPEQLDHEIARLRQQREREQLIADQQDALTDAGIAVIDRPWFQSPSEQLDILSDQDGQPYSSEDPDAHASCPGHAAFVQLAYQFGEPEVRVRYACTDWRGYGHRHHYASAGTRPGGDVGADGHGGGLTEAQKQAQKAERRRVVRNNADWRAAEQVRRDWLRSLVRRKKPPKQVNQFLASLLLDGDYALSRAMGEGHRMALELLGLEQTSELVAKLNRATATEATMFMLTVAVAANEQFTSVDTWRHPSPEHQRYFKALRDWGYTLAPVEQLVLDPSRDRPNTDDSDEHEDPEDDPEVAIPEQEIEAGVDDQSDAHAEQADDTADNDTADNDPARDDPAGDDTGGAADGDESEADVEPAALDEDQDADDVPVG